MLRITLLAVLFSLAFCQTSPTRINEDGCPEVLSSSQCPRKDITFWLYTITNKDGVKFPSGNNTEDYEKFYSSLISRKLVVLIHGYGENVNNSKTNIIKEKLLEIQQANVLSMDYSSLAPRGCYIEAVKNSRVVGRCLAQFIDFLIHYIKVPRSNVHVIGFSLGAQIAGVAGHFVANKLKRITGLDPSKNLILTANNDTFRLDRSDAEYVDIISTDPFQRGIMDGGGHLTFYPNFGIYQPGCFNASENSNEISLCSHKRVTELYAESIVSLTPFYAYLCQSLQQYDSFRCVPDVLRLKTMGYFVEVGLEGSYFGSTNSQSPYARGFFGFLRSGIASAESS
ncbi:hypothetical protein ACFFRR_003726 [Megaselia abdita]